MGRIVAALLTAVSVAAMLAGMVGTSAGAAEPSWPDFGDDLAGEFRSWTLDDGEFIWTNGIFQARGANTDGLHHEDYWGLLATGGELPITSTTDLERHLTWGAFGADRFATDGDQELPTDVDRWPAFTGELAEFRLANLGGDACLRLVYTSMPRPDAQIATITFGNAAAATTEWPHGAGVRSPWHVAVTTWGTGATVTTAGADPIDVGSVGGRSRVGDHRAEVCLPRALLPAGPWTLTGGAGLADPADPTRYWAVPAGAATATSPGSGATSVAGSPVWSLLFANDEPWTFTARSEGDLLVDGDVTPASVQLDPDDLRSGRSRSPAPRTGRLARQYASAFDFGDGIIKGEPAQDLGPLSLPPEVPLDDVARSFEYTGRLQPYGMLVDASYLERTEPWPLIVYLHGLNNYYHEPFGTLPNLELVGERGYLFASVLGRGDLSYVGRGELDVREVIADVMAHYDVDPNRIHLMGHSMGSIGAHHIATRNPDWFASGSPSQITGSDDLLVNLRHVPWSIAGGVEDPLDPFASSETATYGLLAELGYDASFYEYQRKTHESSSIYDRLPSTLDLFDRTRRAVDPAEVVYRRLPGDDYSELGIAHDRAHQVSALRFADDALPQLIRLESMAIPHAPLDPAAATHEEFEAAEGGPSGRDAGTRHATTPAHGDPVEVRNAGTVVLENVAAVTLAADRLGWETVGGWDLSVTSDAPVTIQFSGVGALRPELLLDGAAVRASFGAGTVSVEVPVGSHVLTIAGGGSGPGPADVAGGTLPTTGGGIQLTALVALVGALGLARRDARV